MLVYLAILEDRHIDTVIKVHMTFIGALMQVNDWRLEHDARYSTPYKWEVRDIECWEYSIDATDGEGLSMRIEKKEVL